MNDSIQTIASAVKKAAQYQRNGLSGEDALLKVSSELSLNHEMMKRVCEGLNTANFLSMYKSSDDRLAEFPVVDPLLVIEKASRPSVKTAEFIDLEYEQDEVDFVNFSMLKLAQSFSTSPYPYTRDPNELTRILLQKTAKLEKAAEESRILQERYRDLFHTCVTDLASYFSSPYNPSVDTFSKEAEYLYLDKETERLLGLIKSASTVRDDSVEVDLLDIDETTIPHHIFKCALHALNKFSEAKKQEKQLKSKAVEQTEDLSKVVGQHLPEDASGFLGASIPAKGLAGAAFRAAGGLGPDIFKGMVGGMGEKSKIKNKALYEKLYKADITDPLDLQISNAKRKANLEYLLKTDPQIQEYLKQDPQRVFDAIQTFASLAPHALEHPGVVNAFIRETLASGGGVLHPHMANTLLELESRLKGDKGAKT